MCTGYALKELTDLLASFLELESVRSRHKAPLLGTVLHGYLSLRRLVIQRTKLVDETQERLLQLLEDITSGGYTGLDGSRNLRARLRAERCDSNYTAVMHCVCTLCSCICVCVCVFEIHRVCAMCCVSVYV